MPNMDYQALFMNEETGECTSDFREAVEWYYMDIPVSLYVNGDLVDTWS